MQIDWVMCDDSVAKKMLELSQSEDSSQIYYVDSSYDFKFLSIIINDFVFLFEKKDSI